MKGMMKKTAILLAAALICFLAYAGKVYANPGDEGITDDGIKYQVNGDGVTVTLTGFEAPEGFKQGQVLELPDKVNGLTVTDIGDEAFKDGSDKYKWTGVVFPKDLKTIGAGAFRYDGYLSGTLVIPNSVTSIGNEAFYYCDGLSGLVLSNSLQTIGNSAFYSCTGFTGELKLPTTLTVIGELAFFECSGFTGALKLPRGLVEIKYRAFEGCIGFTGDLVIPNTVTTIGVSAFSGIFMKDGLIVPASVTSIGNGAFYNNYFSSLTVNSTHMNMSNLHNTVGRFYSYKNDNTSAVLGHTADIPVGRYTLCAASGFSEDSGYIYRKSAGKATIYLYKNIDVQDLVIPDSIDGAVVDEIATGAFVKCSGFTGNLTLPQELKTIGDHAFYGCSGFSGELVIPESVTAIGKYAFTNCSGFSGSINIPDGLTELPEHCFENCSGFTGELDPNNLTVISSYCFAGCTGLTGDLYIPLELSVWGGAFSGCDNLNGTLHIGEGARSGVNQQFTAFSNTAFKKIINDGPMVTEVYRILKTTGDCRYFKDGEAVEMIREGTYILRRSIGDATISLKSGDSYVFDGEDIKPAVEVKIGNVLLKEGEDYTLQYYDFNKVGTAKVDISGVDTYFGKVTKEYTIIASTEVAPIDPIPDQVYTGKAYCPEISFGGVKLNKGTDYKIIYQNNVNAGTAVITAIGKGTYTFVLGTTFNILPASISEAVVSDIAPQAYTGNEIKPAVTITVSGNTLVEDRDYTLTYKDNIDKETATVTATGKGNYSGTVSKEFKITGIPEKTDDNKDVSKDDKKDQNDPDVPHSTVTPLVAVPEVTADTNAIYMVKGQKFTLPEGTWEIKDNVNKTVNLKKGVLTAKKVGTAKIARGTQIITVKVIQPKFAEKSWTEEAGKEITLALDGFDKEHYGILWSSSNVDVATVSGNGTVKTQSKGTATITAYVNGKTYSCKLKVTESTIAAERTLHINIGTPGKLKIAGVKNPTWEVVSGNAVLQGKNKVKAETPGTSKLVAKTSDGKSYVVYVITEDIGITAPGMEDKGKNKYSMQLAPKATAQISFKGVDRQIIWKSSSPEKAYVDENGVIHALSAGKSKFTTKVNGKNITINVVVK